MIHNFKEQNLWTLKEVSLKSEGHPQVKLVDNVVDTEKAANTELFHNYPQLSTRLYRLIIFTTTQRIKRPQKRSRDYAYTHYGKKCGLVDRRMK